MWLGGIAVVAAGLYLAGGDTDKGYRFIVLCVALFGAAAVMTFWEQLFPEF